MSARDELAYIIGGKLITRSSVIETADAVRAAGYRRPRTITTEEERQALPDLAVVRTAAGTIACVFGGAANFFGTELTAPISVLALPIVILFDPAATE